MGKIVRVTGPMYITQKVNVNRKNYHKMRLKSNSADCSGKQATPVKKWQKRPAVLSSTSISPEDDRPFKLSSTRTSIAAKTFTVPIRPKPPTLLQSDAAGI